MGIIIYVLLSIVFLMLLECTVSVLKEYMKDKKCYALYILIAFSLLYLEPCF